MGKKNPKRRKRSPQFPSIAVGGGEGFSIPIIDELNVDIRTTPPPGEADTRKGIPQSKPNGVESSPPTYPQSNLEGVDNFLGGSPQSKLKGVGKVSRRAGINPKGFPQSEDCPRFFSHYSKQLPQEEEFSPQPYSNYPQCQPHPPDVIRSVRQLLKSRGVIGARELSNRYPLEIILDAINSVDAMISVGVEVREEPRLILWRLKRIAANGESES